MAIYHNETRTRDNFYETVANSAEKIVLFTSGMLTCALLLILTGIVESQNDIVKGALAGIVALFATSLTIFFTRGLDALKDRRDLRRKLRGNVVQIQSIKRAWRSHRNVLREILADNANGTETLSNREIALLFAGCETLRQLAATMPSFADILDGEDDFAHADSVRRVFGFTSTYFVVDEVVQRQGKAFVAGAIYANTAMLDAASVIVDRLEAAEQHFSARLQT